MTTARATRFLMREPAVRYIAPICRVPPDPATLSREDRLIERARKVLARRLMACKSVLDSPAAVRDFLLFELAGEGREVFYVIFLDTQNQPITFEPLFVGTLSQTSVHPREVVRRCIEVNAAAIIIAHNHPSGIPEPSAADRNLTSSLRWALSHIDVKVLDHLIVGGALSVTSFAERGLL